ncbi:uncharacterized protein A4U43_C02F22780 [Asparagus officinalis]|uniref:Uncharacterized protein n=1 Tax=Asparagus officinalis TaxID=4686 RepID=A0A5P1FQ41_ASPOF|nr:uncharacterized protein A4U43_C02F22780 [Asparagus officinalis]
MRGSAETPDFVLVRGGHPVASNQMVSWGSGQSHRGAGLSKQVHQSVCVRRMFFSVIGARRRSLSHGWRTLHQERKRSRGNEHHARSHCAQPPSPEASFLPPAAAAARASPSSSPPSFTNRMTRTRSEIHVPMYWAVAAVGGPRVEPQKGNVEGQASRPNHLRASKVRGQLRDLEKTSPVVLVKHCRPWPCHSRWLEPPPRRRLQSLHLPRRDWDLAFFNGIGGELVGPGGPRRRPSAIVGGRHGPLEVSQTERRRDPMTMA